MDNRVFRKVSLDRLSSPEQLDQVMQVTNPRGWLALAAVGSLLAMAIGWGIWGTLSEKVAGGGILLKSGGVFEVVSPAEGRVTDVSVSVGDSVTEGQVVAWIAQPELSARLQEAKTRLAALRGEYERTLAFAGSDAQLQSLSTSEQQSNLRQTIAADEQNLRWLGERITSQEQLVSQGLLTRAALLQTRQTHEQTRERIRTARSQLAQLEVQAATTRNDRSRQVSTSRREIELAQLELDKLANDLRRATQVVSPYTGRILEVTTEQGKMVGRGESVLNLDLTGSSVKNLVAVIYVPSVHGKRVRPGMTIQIAPSTVRQEEFGMMLGKVTFVSNFPATPRGMGLALKNEKLVQSLSGNGAPYEVHADLIVDPSTVSRYRWSSSGGPPVEIQSGTLASGLVTVDRQRPLGAVLPLMRRWTGM
ncbi:MAG TPA: NHLP bacteriocin system secretion protein [Longimicrobium sp.]|jgi:HlyD family secretion protein|uniref:NHLP bacteriocin system secretion protein n=1 Tax=Longimicrobium sp. TaxID=2029185 RepID=UPI002ED8A8D3